MKKYTLNTKSIRKAMKNYEIKVLNCYKGKGTTRNATYITIDSKDLDKALSFFGEFGIVSATGRKHTKMKSSNDTYSFGASYMSEEMYNELQSYGR